MIPDRESVSHRLSCGYPVKDDTLSPRIGNSYKSCNNCSDFPKITNIFNKQTKISWSKYFNRWIDASIPTRFFSSQWLFNSKPIRSFALFRQRWSHRQICNPSKSVHLSSWIFFLVRHSSVWNCSLNIWKNHGVRLSVIGQENWKMIINIPDEMQFTRFPSRSKVILSRTELTFCPYKLVMISVI